MYLVFCVFPLLLMSTLLYFIYYRTSLQKADNLLNQNEWQYEAAVTAKIDSYKAFLYEIVTDKVIIQLAQKINNSSFAGDMADETALNTMLQNYTYTYREIKSIAFLADTGPCVSYSRWYTDLYQTIWSDKIAREKVFLEIKKHMNITILSGINLSGTGLQKNYVILLGIPVCDLITKKTAGVLIVALNNSILDFTGDMENGHKDRLEETGVTEILVNEYNTIIAAKLKSAIHLQYEDFVNKNYVHRKHIYEIKKYFVAEKWTIISIVNKPIYLKEIYVFMEIMILFTSIITVLFFSIWYIVTRYYLATITEISREIGTYMKTSGNERKIRIDSHDELYVIAFQFNKMTKRVSALIDALKQKNNEIQKAMDCRRQAEIRALEAQINPHFLYNTLDTLSWRAIEHGETEISDIVGMLGDLLRYSISGIDTVVTLSSEISWLRKYIYIQRTRFNNAFDCVFDIEDAAESFPIYKMLLQPIIENCITHAFEDTKADGKIFVQAYVMQNNNLNINIQDNGKGIEKTKLEELQQEFLSSGQIVDKNIGIGNVYSRLHIYYGGKASMTVSSEQNKGATFVLCIPDITVEAEKNDQSNYR